jgi:hypothetical protein
LTPHGWQQLGYNTKLDGKHRTAFRMLGLTNVTETSLKTHFPQLAQIPGDIWQRLWAHCKFSSSAEQ